MEKDKILEMSRAENENSYDERIQHLKLKAYSFAGSFMVIFALLLMAVALIFDLDEAFAMVASIYFGWTGCVRLAEYYHLRKRTDLISGILNAIVAILEIVYLILLVA